MDNMHLKGMDCIKTASGMKFADALDELKAEEFDESSLLVVDDEMMQMIAAWPRVRRVYQKEPIVDIDMPEIWGNVGFMMIDWATLANVHEGVVWKHWKTIIAHGLIYPDGTLPDRVRDYLRTRVEMLMGEHDNT